MVEQDNGGTKSLKPIDPNTLIQCINKSLVRGGVASGLLPRDCISFNAHDNGDRDIVMVHHESYADVTYYDTLFPRCPLPRLLFGFRVSAEGRVSKCRLGVVDNVDFIKPDTKLFHYPLSNVSGFSLCVGNNVLPKAVNLYTLNSLPHFLISLPNNDHSFHHEHNKRGLGMRELLVLLASKDPEFYYSDVLLANAKTVSDFINKGE
jgi:hypothetical protein